MLSESSANASFEIRGLSIVRFSDDGVQVGADNTVIAQNFIGLFPDGSAGTIGDVGIEVINGAAGAVSGGSASDGNVIGSTRDDGVRVDDGTSTVVDLDAALGTGNNTELIKELLPLAPCRVGGGIRSVEAAIEWLDAGATKVVLGTAATTEVLSQLPPERTVVALDSFDGRGPVPDDPAVQWRFPPFAVGRVETRGAMPSR